MRAAVVTWSLLAALAALPACVEDKGEEEEAPSEDGKDDSFQKPTHHGAIAFGAPQASALTDAERHHTWTFELSGQARVDMTTSYAVLGQRRTDTVLYLYRKTTAGTWGPYIARNDDYGTTTYSQLVRELGAGEYRVLVKGYLASTRGKFKITVGCQGDGCVPPAPPATDTCVFPEDWRAMRNDNVNFVPQGGRTVTADAQLDELEHGQVLAALERAFGPQAGVDAGLAMTDDRSVDVKLYRHQASGAELTVVAFYAGDTSLGTIYYGSSQQVAGVINDLFIEQCSLFAPRDLDLTAGASCRATSECAPGLACHGVFAGAGHCASTARPAGEGNECTSDAACGSPDLVCAGVTRGYGLCAPAWMRRSFTDGAVTAIPDAGTLARRIAVRGLASVDTDVALRLTIDHPRASQLRVTLVNPATAEVLVHDGTAADDGRPLVIDRVVHGFSGDEQVNGEWTLRVQDRAGGSVGTLRDVTLTITSRWD